ncbi:rhamnogalacturonan acetylesterase [Paenibacillus alginolyticus]|uniref:Rhamnogalacturonan acetylesterase n=1 Tax=Paenibacillus alginolyticus TaxID=59839 RepID=A0ABT4G8L6_9BACL|nr:rhamnogalacturonan acetylesterase [Paenibacillus alginolyticus]MCY9668093.1 rhamnogalacturonan acetylesterase [Paenibacillus alginolyticus]MCY9692484.1 rhamnogalacturonan acetylesterase [Paenibacillus alginolyticus]MEC0144276.1 rhamnogalacturonan acetylesterase [Paenibacillus alginolyticus]
MGGWLDVREETINIYLAEDSTVQEYTADWAPQAGWGQFIAEYFNSEVRFHNRGIGGRSSKTFVEEGRLEAILEEIGPGDYLFVQMGHNDSTTSKPERYTEPYTTYKHYLKMYIDNARLRGATPIFITPMARLHYEDGTFINDFPDYCIAMKLLAEEEKVQLVDLMTISLEYYSSIGYDEAVNLFMISVNGTDCTHFTDKGARRIAKILAEAIKESGEVIVCPKS